MSVLPNGYGSPFFRIFYEETDKDGISIFRDIPDQFVPTELEYKFSEEDDDLCKVTFESQDATMADRPFFQEGRVLQCVWGYIGGIQSEARLVYIRDIEPLQFGETVKLTLTCTDKAAFMKDVYNNVIWGAETESEEDTFDMTKVIADFCKKYGLKLHFFFDTFDFRVNPATQYFEDRHPSVVAKKPNIFDNAGKLLYEEKVTVNQEQFVKRVKEIGQELSVDPDWLMAIMNFESAGTFSPSKKNPQSDAVGLIQFTPDTAADLGTSTAALAQLSNVEQLKYVKKYLTPYSSKFGTFTDVYLSVFFPKAIGKHDGYILETPSISRATIAAQNPGFDPYRQGYVTVGNVKKVVERLVQKEPTAAAPNDNNDRFAPPAPPQDKGYPFPAQQLPSPFPQIPSEILTKLARYNYYPQANKSDWLLLWEMLKKQPGGPWVSYGRDDELHVGKRDLKKTPFKTYTYRAEDGELLSVEIHAKGSLTESESEQTSITSWDAENKTFNLDSAANENTETTKTNDWVKIGLQTIAAATLLKGVKSAPKPSGSLNSLAGRYGAPSVRAAKWSLKNLRGILRFSNLALFLVSGLERQSDILPEIEFANVGDVFFDQGLPRPKLTKTGDNTYERKIYTPRGGVFIQQVTINPDSVKTDITYRGDDDATRKNVEMIQKLKTMDLSKLPSIVRDVVKNFTTQHSREDIPESVQAEAANRKQEMELEKIKISVDLLPHPQLTSSEMLTILGIGNKYSGNYYIKECTHKLTQGDYSLTAELNGNAQGQGDVNTGNLQSSTSLPGTINTTPGPTLTRPQHVKIIGVPHENDLNSELDG